MKEFEYTSFNGQLKIAKRFKVEDGKKIIHSLHFHDNYEIIRLLSGSASYQVKDMVFSAHAGDVILIDRNLLHHIMPDNNYGRLVISLDNRLKSLFNFSTDFFSCFKMADETNRYVIKESILKEIMLDSKLNELSEIAKSENAPKNQDAILFKMVDILICIRDAFSKREEAPQYEKDEIISKIIQYVDENLETDLSLEKIGTHIFLSKFYLCHYFKSKTSMSLFSYIQNKRIIKAKILIENGVSAQEAAYATGFNNYSNFYKAFKKITGNSPTQQKGSKE